MATIISIILAIVVGFPIWAFIAVLSDGIPFLGHAGLLEGALFFAPIVFVAVPASFRLFADSAPATGVWIIALAPLLGLLNIFLAILAFGLIRVLSGTIHEDAANLAIGVLFSCAWAFPLISGARRSSVSGKSNDSSNSGSQLN